MTNTVKKINMIDAVKLYFKNYFNFTGRASRMNTGGFMAYVIVVVVIIAAEGLAISTMLLLQIITLATLIGWLSLNARRLQDAHNGLFYPNITIEYYMLLLKMNRIYLQLA